MCTQILLFWVYLFILFIQNSLNKHVDHGFLKELSYCVSKQMCDERNVRQNKRVKIMFLLIFLQVSFKSKNSADQQRLAFLWD